MFAIAVMATAPCAAEEDLDAAAAAIVKSDMLSWFRDGPDSTTLSYRYSPGGMAGSDWWGKYAWQYKGLSSRLEAAALTSIDRLNELMWRGRLTLTATAVRTFVQFGTGIDDSGRPPCWTEWQVGPSEQRAWIIERRHESWKISSETSPQSLINQLFGPGDTVLTDDNMAQLLKRPSCS